ncbi:MAG: DUF1501 domain-containing protein [Planctomycetaceae bacterium]
MNSSPDPAIEHQWLINRRKFFGKSAAGIGVAALSQLLNGGASAAASIGVAPSSTPAALHFAPKAKRMIYLFQSGAPSHVDLFDYKPALDKLDGTELPDSVRRGQRLTGMTAFQKSMRVTKSPFGFKQCGASGATLSNLLPNLQEIADELCFIKTINTEAINHDPAITFFQTGSQIPGRPSTGAWLSYGLGSENADLPTFIVMASKGTGRQMVQPLYNRLWGAGFLPSSHQGVKFRSTGEPMLYLSTPAGISREQRRGFLDDLAALNEQQLARYQDPETAARIQQYEMAYRMQASVPELLDLSNEPQWIFDLYGPESRIKGKYAYNCLLARRLAERGVRFIQLFHMGWDQHETLERDISNQCRDTDRASAALIIDLKQRGLLDDTLVVWGGEFGRTVFAQGDFKGRTYGRDHHPRCFTQFLAGGGVRPGTTYGETDDFCYNVVRDPVHVHDLHATLLHLLGINHEQLTFRFQGRDYRLTDVHGRVVDGVLS